MLSYQNGFPFCGRNTCLIKLPDMTDRPLTIFRSGPVPRRAFGSEIRGRGRLKLVHSLRVKLLTVMVVVVFVASVEGSRRWYDLIPGVHRWQIPV